MAEEKTTLDFHHIKTSSYRSYYSDGAFGALTPAGKIYLDFYLERLPTPQVVTMEMSETEEGLTKSKEISREGKNGIVREIEFGLMMDVVTAIKLRDFLDIKITEFQKIFLAQKEIHE